MSSTTGTTSSSTTSTQTSPFQQYGNSPVYFLKIGSFLPSTPNTLSFVRVATAFADTDVADGLYLVFAYYDPTADKYLFNLAYKLDAPKVLEAPFPAVSNNLQLEVYMVAKSTQGQYSGTPEYEVCVTNGTPPTALSFNKPTQEVTLDLSNKIGMVMASTKATVKATINNKPVNPETVEAPQDTDVQNFLSGKFGGQASAVLLKACGQVKVDITPADPTVVLMY